MRAALPNHHPLHRMAAGGTGLARSPVHLKMILKPAAAVHPVDAGAVVLNARGEHRPNGGPQARGLGRGERIGAAQGMNARPVQGLIGINIAQASQKGLVEQQGFDQAMARL